jgi:hypothetical protein
VRPLDGLQPSHPAAFAPGSAVLTPQSRAPCQRGIGRWSTSVPMLGNIANGWRLQKPAVHLPGMAAEAMACIPEIDHNGMLHTVRMVRGVRQTSSTLSLPADGVSSQSQVPTVASCCRCQDRRKQEVPARGGRGATRYRESCWSSRSSWRVRARADRLLQGVQMPSGQRYRFRGNPRHGDFLSLKRDFECHYRS